MSRKKKRKDNAYIFEIEGTAKSDAISGNHFWNEKEEDFCESITNNKHFKQFLGKKVKVIYIVQVQKPRNRKVIFKLADGRKISYKIGKHKRKYFK